MRLRFRAWELGEDEEECLYFDAYSPGSAAEEWAEEVDRDSADYSIVGGADALVVVREVATGKLSVHEVTGESEPVYHAYEEAIADRKARISRMVAGVGKACEAYARVSELHGLAEWRIRWRTIGKSYGLLHRIANALGAAA
jgi:hypothetical protein